MMTLQRAVALINAPRIRNCNWAMRGQRNAAAPTGDLAERRGAPTGDPAAGYVGIWMDPDGSAHADGLQHCGSVWACPMCSLRICTERARELSEAADLHGKDKIGMITLTFRHGFGDSLKGTRKRCSRAWEKTRAGDPWKRFVERTGWGHSVRAMEVTYGKNGWHVHLHVLVFLNRERHHDAWIDENGRYVEDVDGWDLPMLDWLRARWQSMVRKYMGERHVPDDEHGVVATGLDAAYLSKMGCELSDPGHKVARGENRTPWEIAADWNTLRNEADARLWRIYCAGMKGARKHYWSPGARKHFELHDKHDHELAEEDRSKAVEIYRLAPPTWGVIKGRWVDGVPALVLILEAAELGGDRAVEYLVLRMVAGEEV